MSPRNLSTLDNDMFCMIQDILFILILQEDLISRSDHDQNCAFIYSFIHSFIHLFFHPLIKPFNHSFIHSSIHCFHSFIQNLFINHSLLVINIYVADVVLHYVSELMSNGLIDRQMNE